MGSGRRVQLFATPDIVADPAGDGGWLLRSAAPLDDYPPTVVHSLRARARAAPDHPLCAERTQDGTWRTRSYGEAVTAAESIGQALLDAGLGPDRPLLILSGNSVDHLLMTLGAMTAGIPVVPLSAAYSLHSRDHARIRAIADLIYPGAVFADKAGRFAAALDAIARTPAIVSTGHRPGARQLSEMTATKPGPRLAAAFSALAPRRSRRSFSPPGRPEHQRES